MLVPGLIIDERFTLTRRLDRGGMGEVWIARESEMRDVAIKFILPEQQNATLRERFLAEVKTAAQLHSAYTCRVYHWGTHDGSPYMVMELLDGANLAERLRSFGRVDPVKLAVDYVAQACAALVEAHALGVVHRDIKPANLFLDERAQQIKVLDFGVAKATEAIRASLSSPGGFLGTVAYSPPEQLVAASQVTVRSDIWSLGAVLYELLAGFPPFPQDFPEVLSAIAQREPRSLGELRPEVPEGLCRAIQKCLAKDPQGRWADVTALLAELASYGGSESRAIAERILGDRDARRQARYDALPDLHSEEALVEAVFTPRLTADGSQRRVVFMLGAGFSAPTRKRDGIPGTDEIVRLIKKQLPSQERARLSQKLRDSTNKYQEAFEFLTATRSADAANVVIRSAVLQAYRASAKLPDSPAEQERKCREFEADLAGWSVPEGVSRLARIVATGLRSTREDGQKSAPYQRFSALHLTTNFDPLLAVSIRKHGGACLPYTVEKDFEIPEPEPDICLLVHLHGRWNRGDTLHANLGVRRSHLEQSLSEHLERAVLVVLGYGGWDDVFMRTLRELTRRRSDLDVLWAHFSNDPQQIYREQGQLITDLQELGPRVQFYRGVDSNRFFARLTERLEESAGPSAQTDAPLTMERRGERSARSRVSFRSLARPGGALAMAAATLGALLWFRRPVSETQPAIPPDPPTAGAANSPVVPAAPELVVACAEPVPSGGVRIDDALVPLERLCAGRFETKPLVIDYPGLLATKHAVLEPSHLFYGLALTRTGGVMSLTLERKERAQVELAIAGPGCARFKTLRVKAADDPALVFAELNREQGELSCNVKLSLPFTASGRRLSFEFEPRGYRATDAEFLSSTLRTTLSKGEPVPVPIAAKPVPIAVKPVPIAVKPVPIAPDPVPPPADPCAAKCRYIRSCRQDPQGGPCNGDDMAHIIACCSTVYAECRSGCK